MKWLIVAALAVVGLWMAYNVGYAEGYEDGEAEAMITQDRDVLRKILEEVQKGK